MYSHPLCRFGREPVSAPPSRLDLELVTLSLGAMAGTCSVGELRQRYNAATRALLVRDYAATASSLHDALARCPRVDPSAWFDELRDSGATLAVEEIRRRLEILQITFLATVRSSPAALSPASNLTPLLDLPPARLVRSLWQNLLSTERRALPSVEEQDAGDDILPTPSAAYLHPSLAVSLTLAALKLDEPKLARAIAEAWFGSVSEDVERMVWETSGTVDWDNGEFSLDGAGGLGASSMLGTAGKDKPDGRKQLVGAWLKLLDLLVLHVLPTLDEWEAAGDFVRLQGQENGGWVPDQRVEVCSNEPLFGPAAADEEFPCRLRCADSPSFSRKRSSLLPLGCSDRRTSNSLSRSGPPKCGARPTRARRGRETRLRPENRLAAAPLARRRRPRRPSSPGASRTRPSPATLPNLPRPYPLLLPLQPRRRVSRGFAIRSLRTSLTRDRAPRPPILNNAPPLSHPSSRTCATTTRPTPSDYSALSASSLRS